MHGVIENRVPDVRFLLDQMLAKNILGPRTRIDDMHVGLVGHSFGGWAVLAAPDSEPRVRAVWRWHPVARPDAKPAFCPFH